MFVYLSVFPAAGHF